MNVRVLMLLSTMVAPACLAQVRVTEFMYTGNGPEFLELTNTGSAPIDLLGWSVDDSRRQSGAFAIGDLGSIAPGESVVITESEAEAFRSAWGLPPTIRVVGRYGVVSGNNLGRSDEINVFDGAGSLVDRITYGDEVIAGSIRTRTASGWCQTSALGLNDILGWRLSATGDVQGSWTSAAGDVGSPGTHAMSDTPSTLPPRFSHDAGLYDSSFQLSLEPSVGVAAIHYTLDGSDPTTASPRYQGPITIASRAGEANRWCMIRTCPPEEWRPPVAEVFKITTVRAIAVREGATVSPIMTRSFLVGPGVGERHSLPVISVVTDPDNLFDHDIGIYVPGRVYDEQADPATQLPWARPGNYTQEGSAWERPGHVEFFETDGRLAFSQGVGLRIHGGVSTTYQQKSLRVYASGEYGPA